MNTLTYIDQENIFEIRYRAFWDKKEHIKIILKDDSILIQKNGKESNIDLVGATDIIFTASQNSPPKQQYSEIFVVTSEVYLKTGDEPLEIATFLSFEPKSLMLRDTQGFKVAELLASKLGSFYKLDCKFQYEIITKKNKKGLHFALAFIFIMWAALALLLILSKT